jgi:hypothetical protein
MAEGRADGGWVVVPWWADCGAVGCGAEEGVCHRCPFCQVGILASGGLRDALLLSDVVAVSDLPVTGTWGSVSQPQFQVLFPAIALNTGGQPGLGTGAEPPSPCACCCGQGHPRNLTLGLSVVCARALSGGGHATCSCCCPVPRPVPPPQGTPSFCSLTSRCVKLR